jgi:hypothetical protein
MDAALAGVRRPPPWYKPRMPHAGRYRVVKRFTPPADGRFRVTLAGPPSRQAAVYRLQTRVRKFTSNPKVFPTFTLPRYVDLAQ